MLDASLRFHSWITFTRTRSKLKCWCEQMTTARKWRSMANSITSGQCPPAYHQFKHLDVLFFPSPLGERFSLYTGPWCFFSAAIGVDSTEFFWDRRRTHHQRAVKIFEIIVRPITGIFRQQLGNTFALILRRAPILFLGGFSAYSFGRVQRNIFTMQ